jgi:DNA-binding NtrC family response regulator
MLPASQTSMLAQLVRGAGMATVPVLEDAPAGALVRWLYRLWLDETPEASAPLMQVWARHLAGASPDWWHAARGGWLHLDGLTLPSELEAPAARGAFMRVLCEDPSWRIVWEAAALERLRALDALHAARMDPALGQHRRHLKLRCAQREAILLQGEPGCGAAELVRWAQLACGDVPLKPLGEARWHEWALCESLTELDEAGWRALGERLREPARRGWAPVLGGAQRPDHPAFARIIGQSAALCGVLERAMLLAPHRLPVLITGEPGVGKELLARAIHEASGRSGAFVALDMGALSEQLAESELFGHKKGAFTGADSARVGAFRAASGGTLLLDEIGNLSLPLQAKLLRALQEGEVRPVGEDRPQAVDVRVIAATNVDLEELGRRGLFRLDLLGRLRGAHVELPPLRERAEDIVLCARAMCAGRVLSEEALEALKAYSWPGNVRELSHVVQAAAAVTPPGEAIRASALGLRGLRGPTLVLGEEGSVAQATAHLGPAAAQRLCAAPLRVPALRERGAASRQALWLHALAGRAVSGAALQLLQDHPWWGNHIELEACARLLNALPDGPIEPEVLRRELPQLSPPAALAPIHVLMSPALVGPGQVGGLTQEFDAGALLIGRVSGVHELDLAARRGDARADRWLRALRQHSTGTPACLALSHLRTVSRAQALVTRAEGGLSVMVLPETSLEVLCGPLGEPLVRLEAEAPLRVGLAAEVWLTQPGATQPELQLFVFAGRAVATSMGLDALAAAERLRDPMLATTHVRSGEPVTEAPDAPEEPGAVLRWRVWGLSAAESEALVDVLASFEGGQLKHHLLTALPANEDRKTARLGEFLRGVPRLSQYLVRLLALPENAGVVAALAARYAGMVDGAARAKLLPRGVQELMQGR